METLTNQDYLLLSHLELEQKRENSPLFKVTLYADLLKEKFLETIFIQILKCPPPSVNCKQEFYERCISEILRNHKQSAYAYENEVIT